MEVALLAGASMATGLFFGAAAAAAAAAALLLRSNQDEPAPVQALVPWEGEQPAKVRRLNGAHCMEVQRLTDTHCMEAHDGLKEIAALRRELSLCQCALAQSCAQLRRGHLQLEEMQRHVEMLALLGRRMQLEPALLNALPEMASGRCGSSASSVLSAFESCLQQRVNCLEQRLLELTALMPQGVMSAPQRQALPHDWQWRERRQASPDRRIAGPTPIVEELESDEEPLFVNFLEGKDRVPKRRRSEPEEPPARPKKRLRESVKDPAELTLLALMEHGSYKEMSIIKGFKSEDVKKVMAHRKSQGPLESLEDLPSVLGRRLSVKKLISENAA